MLGLVQGATELLPISSSGHLILVPWLADWEYLKEDDRFNQTFDVALHVGTLIAVVAYFRARHRPPGRGVLGARCGGGGSWARDERIAWFIAAATVPAAITGALGEELIADNLGEPWQIAILLAVFGVLLWVADRRPQKRHIDDLTFGRVVRGRARADARARARGLALGHHDHGRPLPRPRPRLGRALLVPAARADHARRRALEGPDRRRARRPPARLDGPVRGRRRSPRRSAASLRSSSCCATCARTRTTSSSSTA